jgi:uncharacterized protein (DUF1684 family)
VKNNINFIKNKSIFLTFEKNNSMQKISLLIILLISLTACSQKKDEAIEAVKKFQYEQNLHFADKKTSPLTEKDFITFSSLDFFKINKDLRINAKFVRTPNETPFDMLTTTSRLAKYVKYGEAQFKIDSTAYVLEIYQNIQLRDTKKYKNHLFLPFNDLTNGKTSYSGGRFIDLNIPKGDRIIIDFNQAYNPYCAYNYKYSCPIPPKANFLKLEINAGVKKYH